MDVHNELIGYRRLDGCNITAGGDDDDEQTNTEILVGSLRVYGSFFVCIFPIYCYVRKRFKRVYAVRQWVDVIKSPLAADQFGYFSWIWRVYSFRTKDMVEEIGLDAVCFLRLMNVGLRLAIIGCLNSVWLFPVYLTAKDIEDEDDSVNKVSINVLPEGSNRFFATVVASYFFYGYAFYTLLKEFQWFITQRHSWLRKFNQRNYTVFVRNIPPAFRSNVLLREHFQLLYGDNSGE